jgi:hypothetical protein
VVIPQRSSLKPVDGLPLVMLSKRLHGEPRQPKDMTALPRLGVANPAAAVRRSCNLPAVTSHPKITVPNVMTG